ncbi:MAG TPA: GAF domain-containing protein [Herpetosiphonaceae bacterium]
MNAAPLPPAHQSRRVFRYVLLLSAIVTISGPLSDLVSWLLGGNNPPFQPTSLFNMTVLAVLPALWVLEQRGFYRMVSLVWLGLSLITITVIAYFFGGALSPVSVIYLLPVVTSGFLLNPRAIFGAAVAAGLCYLALVLNDRFGLITIRPAGSFNPYIFNAIHLVALFMQAMATWLLTSNLAGALKIAQQRGTELEYERATLSRTVLERTAAVTNMAGDAQRRAKSLQTIHTVTRMMLGHTEPRLLLEALVRQLHDLFHYRCVSVFTLEGQGSPTPMFRLQACFLNDDLLPDAASFTHPANRGIFGHVAATGAGYYAADTASDPLYVQNPLSVEFGAELSVPLLVGEQVVGVLSISDREPRAFTAEDQEIIEMVADQLALALEHAQLVTDLHQRRAMADLLRHCSQELSASLHVETVLERLMELSFVVVPGTRAAQLVYQLSTEQICDLVRSGDGTVRSLVREGTVDLPMQPPETPLHMAATPAYGPISLASTTYALAMGDETLALLTLYVEQPGSIAASEPIMELCRLAEQALDNARLYAILRLINTITRHISADLSLEALLERLASHLAPHMPIQLLTLVLQDAEGGALRVAAQHPGAEPPPSPEMIGDFVGLLAATREVRIFQTQPQQLAPHPRFVEFYQNRGYESLCAVPLMLNADLLGVLSVHSHHLRPFNPYHQRVLDRLAPHLAQSINTVRIFHQREQALAEAQSAQNELLRATRLRTLGELASGMAHDFNNMLTGILGNVELLLLDEEDPERRDSLTQINQAARDGAQSVRRLHEFARNKSAETRQLVNLNDLAKEALILTRHRWRRGTKYPPFEIVQDLGALPDVTANPTELREVLVNLLLNAFDAMPQGGTLTLESRELADRVELALSDTGVGIAPELQKTLFTPFISTKGATGLGLGLAVSFNTIKRHGGDLRFVSAPGTGTTFTISLPLDPDAPEPAAHEPAAPPRPIAVRRVLVVDDDDDTRLVVARMLQTHDQIVTSAGSGRAALELLRAQPGQFDLVLTDLGMPELNGWEVARQAREIAPSLAVVLITGWGFQIGQDEARARGVDAVIAKPVTLDTLRMVLDSLDRLEETP